MADRPKLLILVPSAKDGGAERHGLCLAEGLAAEFQTAYGCMPSEQNEGLRAIASEQNVEVCGVHYVSPRTGLRGVGQRLINYLNLLKLLRSLKPDLAMIMLPWPNICYEWLLALRTTKTKTILNFCLAPPFWISGTITRRVYLDSTKRGAVWMTASNASRQRIAQHYGIAANQIQIAPTGARSNPALPDRAQAKSMVRQEFGYRPDAMIVLTVGRLCHQKGQDIIVPAIPHLLKEFPQLRFLWIGGDDGAGHSLQSALEEYGVREAVTMSGPRTELLRYYAAADLFLLPTRFEAGYSLVLSEAMACGAPVLASMASGIPEVIRDRQEGCLFRVDDSCSLMESLRFALRNPGDMKRMAQAGLMRQQDFDERAMLAATRKIAQSALQ